MKKFLSIFILLSFIGMLSPVYAMGRHSQHSHHPHSIRPVHKHIKTMPHRTHYHYSYRTPRIHYHTNANAIAGGIIGGAILGAVIGSAIH